MVKHSNTMSAVEPFVDVDFPPEVACPLASPLPQPDEWKTPPLWGVADSAPYFHDGASPTLAAAIQRHAGAATQSRKAFDALRPKDRRAVIAFLRRLRAPLAP